jgi:aryl-alcohol dehydrogenase-like predicted oxidoreductase
MKRREFISKTAMSLPMISMFPADLSSIDREKKNGKIEKRTLGKTGINLSVIGFGGIVVMNATTEQAASRVKEAIDFGVNYFDVAPSYGNAEEMLGPALEPYRKDIYLACKTGERSKDGARRELEESLKKLKTDYFDIYQLHAVTSLEDVDQIFSEDGAMKTFIKAQEEGLVKNLGFSAHSVEAASELMKRFEFDTILFPFNYTCWFHGDFGPQVMEMAKSKDMGILALKSMAYRPWQEGADKSGFNAWYEPLTDKEDARKGLRFTLSHPVTAAIPPGEAELFSMALRLATEFTPMKEDEILEMKEKAMNTEPIFRYPMG